MMLIRLVYLVLVALLVGLPVPQPVSAEQYLPVMAGENLHCDQENDDTPTHLGGTALEFAWDYNLSGTFGQADYGLPVVAPSDGRIVYAEDYAPGLDGWGQCVVIDCTNGPYDLLAHLSAIFVKVGEPVLRGQVIGALGDANGRWDAHIHHQRQDGSTPDAQSVASSYDDVGVPQYGGTYPSGNDGVLDREESLVGSQDLGGRVGATLWWPGTWNAADRYAADNTARRCYRQNYSGGAWGSCAIVYDGLGGARKAYTVRTGFWANGQDPPNGWSQVGGPQSDLGMPITNEYGQDGSNRRQDFQKKYLYFNGSTVSANPYPHGGPGWTQYGWNNQYSYLFALAYERNGARTTVGEPTSTVQAYGNFLRQDFAGGSFGNCCIMYDPNNANGNTSATNEAYLLRGGFYDYYMTHGEYVAFGCPTRDEYASRDPEHWDESTEYPLQNFFRVQDPEPQHYMIWKPGVDVWHSAYKMAWVTQSPNAQIDVEQGTIRTWSVQYRNTGTTTWFRDKNSYPYDYVELVSCDDGGAVVPSFFYSPGLGWIDAETPCTMQETSVAAGSVATFSFQGKIADDAPLGPRNIYFRVRHSQAGLISDWGGMHYVTTVFPPIGPAFGLILRNPATGDWWVRASDGTSFAYPTGQSWPPDRWLSAWAAEGGGYTFTPYVGDPNGDGYDDLIVRRNDAAWYIAWNNANGSFTAQGQALIGEWGTGDYSGRYFFAFANVDNDVSDEMITYDASNANWYVSQYNAATHSYDSYGLWETWGGGVGSFQPLVGDWNGDARTDICLLALSTGHWWVRLSNGSDFYQPTPTDNWCPYWYGAGDQALAGDWNGDRKCDIALLDPSTGHWWVRLSNGSAFYQPTPTDNWCPYWYGAGYVPFVGDFDDDLDTDIALRDAAQGNHWVRLSNTSAFTQPNPDNWCAAWTGTGYQFVTGRFGSGVMGKMPPPGSDPDPEILYPLPEACGNVPFSLHPNPVPSGTALRIDIPLGGKSVTIMDVAGRVVFTSPVSTPGLMWNGRDASGNHLSSGIYFIRLTGPTTGRTTQKLVVLR